MARRRLGPADPASLAPRPAPETKSAPHFPPAPIAQVAGVAATAAALDEVARELSQARASGRMVVDLPLDAIVEDHLIRDRILTEDEDMVSLRDSILAHGQRTPIEVMQLDGADRYGLISGWRRLAAIRTIHEWLEKPGHTTIRALIRQPENVGDAYVGMIEENEIRVGLSHYERARIVALSVERGIFPDGKAALKALFGNVSRAKRSKIGTFLRIYDHLGDALRFPTAIGERLGLQLAAWIRENGAGALRAALEQADAREPEVELATLEAAMKAARVVSDAKRLPVVEKDEIRPGVTLTYRRHRGKHSVLLSGPGLTADFCDNLRRALGPEDEGFPGDDG